MHHEGYFALRRRYPHSTPDRQACRSPSGVCEVDSMSKLIEPHLQSSVNMMHAVASYLRRDIEVVVTGERGKTIEIVLTMRYRPKQGEMKPIWDRRAFRLCDGGGHGSWKFASISVAKRSKSLVNTDFSGTPKATENSISKNISKKNEYPMISAWRQFIYGGISKWS